MAENDQAAPQGGDGGQNTGGDAQQGAEQRSEQGQQPPWGSDEDFDPQRAWQLVQNLRGDLEKAKADRDGLKGKVDEHERGKLSETEKLATDLDSFRQRAEKAEGHLLRMEVATAKGLTLAQAKRLQGANKEELEADADELLETFGRGPSAGVPSNRPREQYRGGSSEPGEAPEEMDPIKLAELAMRGRR